MGLFDRQPAYRVHVCLGPNCSARGSKSLLQALLTARMARPELDIEVLGTSCRDRCDWGPSINVYPGPVFYNGVSEADLIEIIDTHLSGGDPVERCRFESIVRRRS